jgi:hypothetical protein
MSREHDASRDLQPAPATRARSRTVQAQLPTGEKGSQQDPSGP